MFKQKLRETLILNYFSDSIQELPMSNRHTSMKNSVIRRHLQAFVERTGPIWMFLKDSCNCEKLREIAVQAFLWDEKS